MAAKGKKAKLTVGDLRKEIARRLDRALENVRLTTTPEDESIHAVRRNCKRVRAYLDLFAEFDTSVAKRASRLVRDAARELSPYRDSQIISAAIEGVGAKLQARSDSFDFVTIMNSITDTDGMSCHTSATTCGLAKSLRKATKRLKQARKLIKSCKHVNKFPLDVTVLGCSYAAGREIIVTARQTESPESFHDLRKAVKRHFYQCQMIAPLSKAKLKPRIAAVRELGELLGSAQDIAVLRRAIADAASLDTSAQLACQQACDQVAAELQSTAISNACELYFGTASEFLHELER